jgi:alanine dehydrogenase
MGANVHLLDNSLEVLQEIDREFSGRVSTLVSYPFNLRKVAKFANVLVGSVLVPGAPAPEIITRDMVQRMHSRSIVMDVSIDQGGCVATSRPTNHSNPVFLEEDVIHYCVPNMTGVLGRTATHAMSNATWPFIQQAAEMGIDRALEANPTLKNGVYTYREEIANKALTYALEGRE